MELRFEEIARACGGKTIGRGAAGPVRRVSTDSRTIEKGDVFFALKGARYDGHTYINEVWQKGVRLFAVSAAAAVPEACLAEGSFLIVPDTLAAYGQTARYHRRRFKIPVVAVTGSCGKTTVKELVWHVLSRRFKTLKNHGTENNLVGVPKTLLQIEDGHQAVVLELGTNQPGEIERLAWIASPGAGVITQIGHSHLEGLGSLEGVRAEKMGLLKHLDKGGVLFVNGEDPMLEGSRSGVHRVRRAGFSEGCDIRAEHVWTRESGTAFSRNGVSYETPLIGRHNVLNALLAVAIGESFGMTPDEIQKGLGSFRPVPGRLQFRVIEGIHFLDDSYNSNPNSLKAAFEALKDFKLRERKAVVCGDMLEMGAASETAHREAGALIAGLGFDYVIAAGPACRWLVDEAVKRGLAPSRVHHTADAVQAGELCRQIAQPGDRVLVKGSRGMHMEKVFQAFDLSSRSL